ncbi:Oligopeptide transporter 2 [Vanrija pseudolonga]|uniref:Oligopeptide transporter 2 n=1 Tax=Vanrija pseudolonga TaxID=143232 RepID=A0AAF0Y8X2_9TREE|nr:Oligopeptide transporter 2 [Vanrija pseudolonga]
MAHNKIEKIDSLEDEKERDFAAQVAVLSPDAESDSIEAKDLGATKEDVLAAEERVAGMSLERCVKIITEVRTMHKHDQNFPTDILLRMNEFLDNPDVLANPELHADLIHEMKLEAVLVTENSPYAEVRGVVDPVDDFDMPTFTIRVWIIGVLFSGAGAFINQLFSIRMPNISVGTEVAQLLAFPFGKILEKIFPDYSFRLFGRTHNLNPGPFNRKEHMLITIMAAVAFSTPYTGYIVFTQALPMFFNNAYGHDFGYQLLNTLGSNFVGYGLAGLTRRFIVYPSYCVWPGSLATLALNKAFHSDDSGGVPGPFGRIYSWSRLRLFTVALIVTFVYWWIPGYLFEALSYFNWLSWIAPYNPTYNMIVGFKNGLGLNPLPTFDWNMVSGVWPAMVLPMFSITNYFVGTIVSGFMIVAIYWTNAFNTAYLPINSNKTFNRTGGKYNVTRILDSKGFFDEAKYQDYSEPYMSAGNITLYFWFFAAYSATLSYTFLYHRHELNRGFRSVWRDIKNKLRARRGEAAEVDEDEFAEDIHYRLMKKYKEVPEWWYFLVLCGALAIGMAGVGAYPTNTTMAVVIYGVLLALFFAVPLGIIKAVTGSTVTLNVLAEFIGGVIVPGDALAMNYFKMYGYVVTAHALSFANDLKLAHYTKIGPRYTFWAQMIATLISSLVCTSLFNFQMGFKNVCLPNASFKFTCPGDYTFFNAAVFWGSVGPIKIFGKGGRFTSLLSGFGLGFVLPIIIYGLQKAFPRQHWLRQIHPVMMCFGALIWAPYNISWIWPALVFTFISWKLVKPRYLAFWAKYNYVLCSALSAGIAICAIVIFFALQISDINLEWWGNSEYDKGCETAACVRLPLPEKGYFGPEKGHFR